MRVRFFAAGGWGKPGVPVLFHHRAPVGQELRPQRLAMALGFSFGVWSGKALSIANGTPWAGVCLIRHHHTSSTIPNTQRARGAGVRRAARVCAAHVAAFTHSRPAAVPRVLRSAFHCKAVKHAEAQTTGGSWKFQAWTSASIARIVSTINRRFDCKLMPPSFA